MIAVLIDTTFPEVVASTGTGGNDLPEVVPIMRAASA
jgi:hypothetical protein